MFKNFFKQSDFTKESKILKKKKENHCSNDSLIHHFVWKVVHQKRQFLN